MHIERLVSQSINHSINQSISQSVSQSINQRQLSATDCVIKQICQVHLIVGGLASLERSRKLLVTDMYSSNTLKMPCHYILCHMRHMACNAAVGTHFAALSITSHGKVSERLHIDVATGGA